MKRTIFIFGTLTLLLLLVLAMFAVLGRHRQVELANVSRAPSSSNVCVRHMAMKVDSVKVDSAPVSLSAVVAVISGRDASTTYRYEARNNALRSIARRRDLPKEDVASLMVYLQSTQDMLRPERVAALKNDVMNLLRNQEPSPKGLAETLIAMFRSGKHPPAVLDYCIQHLGAMQGEITDDSLRHRIRETFIFAARQTRQSYAGTALYSLSEDKQASQSQKSELKRLTISLCKRGSHPVARISAIQLAGVLEYKEILPILRETLSSSRRDAVLDIVSIGSLGLLGDESDLELLSQFSSDTRRAVAVKAAIKRIKDRAGK